jgi:peptidoglycan/LPS O-acetylase OafA/YrhL
MEYREIKAATEVSAKNYRPDIDGMRALAILSVVIFHAFPNALSGGFVGVDIFFVISGYLISGIIFKDLEAGKFGFYSFYSHRVKRIFPALIVVLPITLAAGWFLLLPDEFRQLGKHAAASVAYLQNFALAGEAGYFDTASELKPLNHMWSLAVEEQFYLLFPAVIVIAYRMGFNVLTLLVIGVFASFLMNIRDVRLDPGVAYYLPQVRFWELLAGGVLAYINIFGRNCADGLLIKLFFNPVIFKKLPDEDRQSVLLNNVFSIAGVALIGVSFVLVQQGYSFPGWWGIGPVGGAFLIIFAGQGAWLNRVVLSSRLMVFIGLISYPLYLWHWPLLSFASIVNDGHASWLIRAGMVAASFVLAWLTYVLIERPLRFGQHGGIKVIILTSVSILVGLVGYFIWRNDGFPARFEAFEKVSQAAGEWAYPGALKSANFEGISFLIKKSDVKSTTIYIGDSNIEQYFPRIDKLIDEQPHLANSAIFKTGGGCFLVPGQQYDDLHSYCKDVMREAVELVEKYPGVDRVVIGSQWHGYMYGIYKKAKSVQRGDADYQDALKSLSAMIKGFVALGKKVYLVTNIPIGMELDPKYIANRSVMDFPNVFKLRTGGIERAVLESKFGKYHNDLIRIGESSGATVLDPYDLLCTDKCDSVDATGNPIYKDVSHLRPTFVRNKVRFLDQTIMN